MAGRVLLSGIMLVGAICLTMRVRIRTRRRWRRLRRRIVNLRICVVVSVAVVDRSVATEIRIAIRSRNIWLISAGGMGGLG